MKGAAGFSLVELLIATSVLVVGLLAVVTGFQFATESVEAGRRHTVATFLAEQRIEAVKSLALVDWADPRLTAGVTTEAFGAIPDAPSYRRETQIADYGGHDCADAAPAVVACKRVRVTVRYRPLVGGAGRERQVDLLTVLVART
ncbi:MAG: prepilin-type N-terminal cleavage/methylation domain-containing protein [Candidatus Rokubacteria bacterium]|nr:prepilin-type N-terminal cleavage/methylation domain-containing protein [Candidatus Rokubacteria bacterium]